MADAHPKGSTTMYERPEFWWVTLGRDRAPNPATGESLNADGLRKGPTRAEIPPRLPRRPVPIVRLDERASSADT
jgi:hypothetical protein